MIYLLTASATRLSVNESSRKGNNSVLTIQAMIGLKNKRYRKKDKGDARMKRMGLTVLSSVVREVICLLLFL